MGLRFVRTVPANKKGSCGITASADLSLSSGIDETSTPPRKILPPVSGMRRNSASTSELLPLPLLPTTPARQPEGSEKDTPRSTGGSPER